MEALMFNEKGRAENVLSFSQKIELKEPKETELTVKMIAASINPADFMFMEGIYRVQPDFPQVAGFEGVGRVVNPNKHIAFSKGDLVAFRSKNAWAELINTPVDALIKLPDNFPLEKGAQISLNPLTAWSLLEESGAGSGDWLILTAGGSSVSRMIIQFAKRKNINTISLVRGFNASPESFSHLDAAIVLDTEDAGFSQKIKETVVGKNIVAVLDAVGGLLVSELISVINAGCKIIHYGLLSRDKTVYANSDIIFKNLQINGFGIDKWLSGKSRDELDRIWNEIITTVVKRDFLMPVSGKFRLNEYREALANSRNDKYGKTLFWMD